MYRGLVKQWALRSRRARNAVMALVHADPSLAIEPLGRLLNRPARFATVESWPNQVDDFHDLSFLFSSNPLNWGIVSLTFEEAAHLWRTAAAVPEGTHLAEIGRFKGGSTFVLAAAMPQSSDLWSYDLHVKLTGEYSGTSLDRDLERALARYSLTDRVHLVVGDSRTIELPGPCGLVFVDGDHSYDGARADFDHWGVAVAPGGHLLFHDAQPAAGIGTHHRDVEQVVQEIEHEAPEFERVGGAGTIVHFIRRA